MRGHKQHIKIERRTNVRLFFVDIYLQTWYYYFKEMI